jgi:hypothetical protein
MSPNRDDYSIKKEKKKTKIVDRIAAEAGWGGAPMPCTGPRPVPDYRSG